MGGVVMLQQCQLRRQPPPPQIQLRGLRLQTLRIPLLPPSPYRSGPMRAPPLTLRHRLPVQILGLGLLPSFLGSGRHMSPLRVQRLHR